MLSYLTEVLTELPGGHIHLLQSSCLACKSVGEAIVMVLLACLNQATADPIRHCLCSPFCVMQCSAVDYGVEMGQVAQVFFVIEIGEIQLY